MPVHDWTRVSVDLFRHFRHGWTARLADLLNASLPSGLVALVERVEGDGLRRNRIVVQTVDWRPRAVLEIVSPHEKDTLSAIRTFVNKAGRLLHEGINLLAVDLFPPTERDPQGIHKAIWDTIREEPFTLPEGQPLTCAAYATGDEIVAYVENVGVGEALPTMPLFLEPGRYVPLDLGSTYAATWAVFPSALKGLLEGPG